jgi:hypothetical protein
MYTPEKESKGEDNIRGNREPSQDTMAEIFTAKLSEDALNLVTRQEIKVLQQPEQTDDRQIDRRVSQRSPEKPVSKDKHGQDVHGLKSKHKP